MSDRVSRPGYIYPVGIDRKGGDSVCPGHSLVRSRLVIPDGTDRLFRIIKCASGPFCHDQAGLGGHTARHTTLWRRALFEFRGALLGDELARGHDDILLTKTQSRSWAFCILDPQSTRGDRPVAPTRVFFPSQEGIATPPPYGGQTFPPVTRLHQVAPLRLFV